MDEEEKDKPEDSVQVESTSTLQNEELKIEKALPFEEQEEAMTDTKQETEESSSVPLQNQVAHWSCFLLFAAAAVRSLRKINFTQKPETEERTEESYWTFLSCQEELKSCVTPLIFFLCHTHRATVKSQRIDLRKIPHRVA